MPGLSRQFTGTCSPPKCPSSSFIPFPPAGRYSSCAFAEKIRDGLPSHPFPSGFFPPPPQRADLQLARLPKRSGMGSLPISFLLNSFSFRCSVRIFISRVYRKEAGWAPFPSPYFQFLSPSLQRADLHLARLPKRSGMGSLPIPLFSVSFPLPAASRPSSRASTEKKRDGLSSHPLIFGFFPPPPQSGEGQGWGMQTASQINHV
jgi:hypothetical protein